jgi:SAM-dependent methyltransferase
MLSTDKAWERFGKEDPYFGVLADEKFATAMIDENRDAFFATGAAAARRILRDYEAHFGSLPRGRALDHGCGVGRLSLPLAKEFAEVLGLDVSQSMVAEARLNADRAGRQNLNFALADDALSHAIGAFDFVNSLMVLQHVPVRRGLRILSRLLAKVGPAGGFHVHVSIRTDRLRSRSLWWLSHHIPGVKIWQNICAGRPWNAPAMQMNNYPLNRIAVLLAANGISDFLISTERHGPFLTCSISGRKRQRPST